MTLPFVDNKEDLYDISRGGGPQCQGVSSPDDRLANDRWGGGQGWPQMARGRLPSLANVLLKRFIRHYRFYRRLGYFWKGRE
ncbi:hypothetical protein CDAR_223311 [Caerostris darwini]|uniref:Uncharacterized protein n=1 Tax=Caerostris darwini TaxID=1538125 RepID=A0AAV4W6A0_9ARAC|nr:hypothetical protein CDAR_223311 [Caerostris darwini]